MDVRKRMQVPERAGSCGSHGERYPVEQSILICATNTARAMNEAEESVDFPNLAILTDSAVRGNFVIGYVHPVEDAMVASAGTTRQVLATLVQREGESILDLQRRLDTAVGEVFAGGEPINELEERGIRFVPSRPRKPRAWQGRG